MNASTHQEAQALQTLEAAVPAQHMLLVPLSQLRPSTRNVRKTGEAVVTELAASIHRVGLLQNLTVILASDGQHYEVVAGGRRLAALKLLAKKKRIAKDYPVPCLRVADASARTASLTENVQREAMSPIDELFAFQALADEGRSVEAIAADFGVTPLVVKRRLKLANVSPRLLAAYREGTVSLDQLMALAITDDHASQELAFFDAPHWQRSPQALRERLTDREIEASRDALARFVGVDAYEAAGGGIRRDLFAEGDQGVYLSDAGLLDALAVEKLASAVDEARSEGWGWVEAVPRVTYAELQDFECAPKERRTPNAREAKRIAKLEARQQVIEDSLNADDADSADDMGEDEAQALYEEGDRIAADLDAIEQSLHVHGRAIRSMAGVIVTVDAQGQMVVHRGLLREAEAKALRAQARQDNAGADGTSIDSDDADVQESQSSLSEKLTRRLSAHRTAALQIEMARSPQVALSSLVHGLVQRILLDGYGRDLPLGISATPQDRLEAHAPDLPQSPAATAMQALKDVWRERLPEDSDGLFVALLAMAQDELVALLAVCVACTVDGVTARADDERAETLSLALGLDMGRWWKPTAEGYFSHVSKAVTLQAVAQFAPDQVNRLSKLKKDALASEAERLAAGTGWMPAMLQAKGEDAAAVEDAATCTEAQDETAETEAQSEALPA